MDDAIMIHVVVAVWWVVAGLVLSVTATADDTRAAKIAVAVFWPIFAPIGLVMVLYRLPFKAASTIRADLRNRALLRDFNRWVRDREASNGGDTDGR